MDSKEEGSDKLKKNKEEKCSKWAAIAVLHREEILNIYRGCSIMKIDPTSKGFIFY